MAREFRYDYNINNRSLSIYDGLVDRIYMTQDFAAIAVFHGYVSWIDNDERLDEAIEKFIKHYPNKLRQFGHRQ